MDTTIRTVGTMAYDETRITEVHPKIAGWVERTFVDYVGKAVRKGQPLLTIYSPELVSTQHEYLLALRARGQLGKSAFAETRSGAESLLEATRDRLRLWDVSDAQVADARAHRGGAADPDVVFALRRSRARTQHVRRAVHHRGHRHRQDRRPFANLGRRADLRVRNPDGEARATGPDRIPVRPVDPRAGRKITFIYPDIDPQTRRARVRIEFANPGLELKPDTYVTVTIHVAGGHALAVPREAVIDTGTART